MGREIVGRYALIGAHLAGNGVDDKGDHRGVGSMTLGDAESDPDIGARGGARSAQIRFHSRVTDS